MISCRAFKPWVFTLLTVATLLVSISLAQAANYIFPGNLPSGCSGSGGTYTCGSLTLGYGDTIAIATPKPATITVNGNLFTNTSKINAAGLAADLTLVVTGELKAGYQAIIQANVTAGSVKDPSGGVTFGGSLSVTTGKIELNYLTSVAGAIASTSGDIEIGQDNVVGGNVTSTSGDIEVGYAARINGDISTRGKIELKQNSAISGKISGSSGEVKVGYAATVSGSITTSSGEIEFAQSSVVEGCVKSTGSAEIKLGYQAKINSVCCGSSCGTACVKNNSTYEMPAQCAVSTPEPEIAAYFKMDETQWNGSANEVLDSIGNNHLSRTISVGSTMATANGNPPQTIESQHADVNGGFCKAGFFDGKAYLKTSGAPAALQEASETTIAAWVYPTAYPSSGLMSIVSNDVRGEFHLNPNGTVNFWTSVSDFNSSSAVPLNQWSHIAVTFKEKRQSIYIDGVLSGSRTVDADLPRTNVCPFWVGGDGGGSNCAMLPERNFKGWIDEVWLASSALTQAEINTIRLKGRVCASPPVSINPAGFNCVEADNNFLSGHLYTKLAETNFSFDVVALKDSNNDGTADAVETNYAADANKSVTVELVEGSGNTACANRTPVSPAVSQALIFNKASQASEQGRKAATMTVNNAYRNLKCRVTDANQSPSIIGCSTDSFAVRPAELSVSSSANAGGGNDALPIVKAGADFSLSAAAGVAGYDGTPILDNGKINAHAGATQSGALSGNFNTADLASGTATGMAFNYSEAGYFRFAADGVYDTDFTAVDSSQGDCSNDFSNQLVNDRYGCYFGNSSATAYFGRFVPDHFEATLNNPVLAPACTTFTYVGQPIKYASNPVATVTAKNTVGGTTQNYAGSFWRIDAGHASYGIVPSYSEASQPLTVLNSAVPAVIDNGNGSGTLNFADTASNILGVTRANPIAPFNAEIAMSFTLQDSDGVVVSNVNGVAASNPVRFGTASAGNGIAFTGGNKTQRWGRLVLGNAYGSELNVLSVPLFAEYFNGTAFVANTSDNCTSLMLNSQLTLSNPDTAAGAVQAGNASMTLAPSGSSKAALANAPLVSGDAGLSFSAPGAGNTGYININGNFAGLPWLLFDWDHNGVQDNSPSARAAFGLYKGNRQQIYLREVY